MYQNKQFKTLRKKLRNNAPDAEKKLWKALRKSQVNGLKFTRQYGVGRFVLDFYCPSIRLGIELDGSQHLMSENKQYDKERSLFLNNLDIKVIRFNDNEVFSNLEGVVDNIIQNAE